MYVYDNLDELDQIIVDGLSGYVDVNNAALKGEQDAGTFILGGRLRGKPQGDTSVFQEALSLGMTALNEKNAEMLADPMPDSPVNRQLKQRLVEHFSGRTNHGLRTALATMGLESPERKLYSNSAIKALEGEARAAKIKAISERAAARAMELISGRQVSAGYPITGDIDIVGGHQVGRATSIKNETPEQILFDGNMEVEGGAEGRVRHELRGRKAADLLKKKLINYLASDAITGPESLRVLDTLDVIRKSRPGRR